MSSRRTEGRRGWGGAWRREATLPLLLCFAGGNVRRVVAAEAGGGGGAGGGAEEESVEGGGSRLGGGALHSWVHFGLMGRRKFCSGLVDCFCLTSFHANTDLLIFDHLTLIQNMRLVSEDVNYYNSVGSEVCGVLSGPSHQLWSRLVASKQLPHLVNNSGVWWIDWLNDWSFPIDVFCMALIGWL